MKKLPLGDGIFMSDYSLKSTKPTYGGDRTHTGKMNARSQGYQYYNGNVELFSKNKKATRKLQAFLEGLNGKAELFELYIPEFKSCEPINNAVTLTSFQYKSTHITLGGFIGEITAGDYFNIANDTKLYRVLNSGKAGDTFEITPMLRKTVLKNTAISFNPVLTVRLKDNSFSTKPNKSIDLMKIKIDFEENL